jgi:hypothetical protein
VLYYQLLRFSKQIKTKSRIIEKQQEGEWVGGLVDIKPVLWIAYSSKNDPM